MHNSLIEIVKSRKNRIWYLQTSTRHRPSHHSRHCDIVNIIKIHTKNIVLKALLTNDRVLLLLLINNTNDKQWVWIDFTRTTWLGNNFHIKYFIVLFECSRSFHFDIFSFHLDELFVNTWNFVLPKQEDLWLSVSLQLTKSLQFFSMTQPLLFGWCNNLKFEFSARGPALCRLNFFNVYFITPEFLHSLPFIIFG